MAVSFDIKSSHSAKRQNILHFKRKTQETRYLWSWILHTQLLLYCTLLIIRDDKEQRMAIIVTKENIKYETYRT